MVLVANDVAVVRNLRCIMQPEPTLVGYLRFLQESKIVWDCLEDIIATSDDPNCVFLHLAQALPKLIAF